MLIARWFGVWTVFDDQLEELADQRPTCGVDIVADAMMSWLRSGSRRSDPGETPFASGFAEVWADIAAQSPHTWQQRFLTHLRQYLAGCRWEADNRRHATVPDLRSYVEFRRRFGGIQVAMDLSEFGGGYALPRHVHRHPAVQALLDALGDITLWGNDLFSAQVDEEEGNVSNLLFVVRRRYGCTMEAARGIVLAMLQRRLPAVEGKLFRTRPTPWPRRWSPLRQS